MLLVMSQLLTHGLVSLMLFSTGCVLVADQIEGSGVTKTETRDVPAFTRVDSKGSAEMIVTIGDKQSLTIEADDNILPLIDTGVKGDKLEISSHGSYSTRTPIKITITVAALNEARVAGSGSISATGIDAKKFDAHVTGSGDINITGKAESLTASISGSGNIDTTKLPVAVADVRVTGSGNAKVNAMKSITATVTGSGDVHYAGNPSEVQEHVTGSGSVKKM